MKKENKKVLIILDVLLILTGLTKLVLSLNKMKSYTPEQWTLFGIITAALLIVSLFILKITGQLRSKKS